MRIRIHLFWTPLILILIRICLRIWIQSTFFWSKYGVWLRTFLYLYGPKSWKLNPFYVHDAFCKTARSKNTYNIRTLIHDKNKLKVPRPYLLAIGYSHDQQLFSKIVLDYYSTSFMNLKQTTYLTIIIWD